MARTAHYAREQFSVSIRAREGIEQYAPAREDTNNALITDQYAHARSFLSPSRARVRAFGIYGVHHTREESDNYRARTREFTSPARK